MSASTDYDSGLGSSEPKAGAGHLPVPKPEGRDTHGRVYARQVTPNVGPIVYIRAKSSEEADAHIEQMRKRLKEAKPALSQIRMETYEAGSLEDYLTNRIPELLGRLNNFLRRFF